MARPNFDHTLKQLISIDSRARDIAPPDLFMPMGPRVALSGSVGLPPQLPKKTAISSTQAKKARAKKKGDDDDDEGESFDAAEAAISSSDDDDAASAVSDSGEGLELFQELLQQTPVTSKKKKKQSAAPTPEPPAQETYESVMRRLLKKSDKAPMHPDLITWTGPLTETQLRDHQLTLTKIRVAAATGKGQAVDALTSLSSHAPPLGAVTDPYEKALKAYCAVRTFADLDLFRDMLSHHYKLNEA